MAPYSSTLAWKIPWTEEPGRLQSIESLESNMTERLHFHFSLSFIGEGNGNPLQCSCLENPREGEAWWAAVYGVTQSRIQLKRFSSSSSRLMIFLILYLWVGLCWKVKKNLGLKMALMGSSSSSSSSSFGGKVSIKKTYGSNMSMRDKLSLTSSSLKLGGWVCKCPSFLQMWNSRE